ncbi:MAG: helix-turn-helix transcriptional regulator [Clostridia bacterium]|nr:helix-turn-helix transcriptional regulator [Clostridia bacterium]
MTFSEKILNLRKARNMSQEELAERLEVSRQAISRWEMGTAMPDAVNILAISKLFGVTTDYLLYDEMERFEVSAAQTVLPEQAKIRRFTNEQYLLTGMVLLQATLTLVTLYTLVRRMIGMDFLAAFHELVFAGGLPMILTVNLIGAQVLAIVFFEVLFSKRNMPTLDHTLYHALFYRVAVWNIAYLALNCVIMPIIQIILWRVHPAYGELFFQFIGWLQRSNEFVRVVVPLILHLALWFAICLIVTLFCCRIIRRSRT